VYTEDSIAGRISRKSCRIRLLGAQTKRSSWRGKIADLLLLEELANQFEQDNGHYPM